MLPKRPVESGNEDSTDTVIFIKQVGWQLVSGCRRITSEALLHFTITVTRLVLMFVHYPPIVRSLSPGFKIGLRPSIYKSCSLQPTFKNIYYIKSINSKLISAHKESFIVSLYLKDECLEPFLTAKLFLLNTAKWHAHDDPHGGHHFHGSQDRVSEKMGLYFTAHPLALTYETELTNFRISVLEIGH
jgi:hypothetical protein